MSAKRSSRRSANELESDATGAGDGLRTGGQPRGRSPTPPTPAGDPRALGRGRSGSSRRREGPAAPHRNRRPDGSMTPRRCARIIWSTMERYYWQVLAVAVLLIAAMAAFDPPIR